MTTPESARTAKEKKPLTPDSIRRAVERLVSLGKPRKLIVNIGPGAIQSATVEHHEAVEP